MCLSIPSKVIAVDGNKALVSVGGTNYEASLQMLDDVKPGDYVLIHTGFAIQKISEEEALETLKVFEDFDDLNNSIKPELDNI